MAMAEQEAPEESFPSGLVGPKRAQARTRYLQQHAEPRDALKGQEQEGGQREALALGKALQPPQLRGEANVCVPTEAGAGWRLAGGPNHPRPARAWIGPCPCTPAPSRRVTLPLLHSHQAAVGLLLILLVPHIVHVHGERPHGMRVHHVAQVTDVGGSAHPGQ